MSGVHGGADRQAGWYWTAVVLAVSAPFLLTLALTLWQTPLPLTEAVANLEDATERSAGRLLVPDASYYRPLYFLTTAAIWDGFDSLGTKLAVFKLVQITAAGLLIALLVCHLRPGHVLEAAAAAVAVAVVGGSQGFQDNLEIPLSYTTVGMPLALAVFMLATSEPRRWHGPAIVLLTLVAVGFKEQGLVIVPVALALWLTGAPGMARRTALTLAGIAAAYVVVRFAWAGSWPTFQQELGVGFSSMPPAEAEARFGAFPYWVYAYSSVSTMLNILFSEPTAGVFRFVDAFVNLRLDWWLLVQFGSSAGMTALIVWWGSRVARDAMGQGWSHDARVLVVLVVAVLACGALSFNYSRNRLGGMAVPFYAIAAYHALRAAAAGARAAPRTVVATAAVGLLLLAASWQSRTFTTIEYLRYTAELNQRQWMTMLPERRQEFAERDAYLEIMESMTEQGLDAHGARQTRYPALVDRILGLP